MNKEKVKGLLHIVAGFFILYRGFESFEKGQLLTAAVYFILSLLCILISAIHKNITKKFVQADTAFFLLESLTLFYSAWHYKLLVTNIISFIYGLAGITFLVFSILSITDHEKPRSKRKSRRRRSRSRRHSHSDDSEVQQNAEQNNPLN